MSSYLLTDFNLEKWSNIDLKYLKESISDFINRLNLSNAIYGELRNQNNLEDNLDIYLSNASHCIKNITYYNNRVYGDIEFIKNYNGYSAKKIIEANSCRFSIRTVNIKTDTSIRIKKIITWDVN